MRSSVGRQSRDHEVLASLNNGYIRSVRPGDTRRFDEILSEDFLCSNPDGSLVDRGRFLEQTTGPVTITGLIAEDVLIRIVDDVAIIHARTRYRTAEGDERQGRYADVWKRHGVSWLAVSAHVTR